MSSDIREVLTENFPITTSEHPFQLSSFLGLTWGLSMEDMADGLNEIKKRVVRNRLSDNDSVNGTGLHILRQALQSYYTNKQWLDKQPLVEGYVDAHDIAEYLQPAQTVQSVRDLLNQTFTVIANYRNELVEDLKACDRINAPVIEILERGEFTVDDAKQVNHLIPHMRLPKTMTVELPLGGHMVGVKQSLAKPNRHVDTLPALTHEEIVRISDLLLKLGIHINDNEVAYRYAWDSLYKLDEEEPERIWDVIKCNETEDQLYAAKVWQWVAKVFSADRIEPLADLTTEMYGIVLALTLWIDRSVK